MVHPELDPWLEGLTYVLAVASIATWLALLVRRTERPFLRFDRRRPVPWGVPGALLAAFFVALPIVVSLSGAAAPSEQGIDHPTRQIVVYIFQQALITGVFLAAIAILSGANATDLGLPADARQWRRGVAIGLVAWLASLLPVQGTQALLFSWLHTPTQHPLVRMVIEKPNPALMAAAFVAAVVVAPICEEITFRLLLQGWLEKWEDGQLGWRTVAQPQPVAPPTESESPVFADLPGPAPAEPEPPRRGLAGLRYGWAPILISSEMFGLAHLGHGTDPIPLFLLGIILGYTYQRTHKIIPCIVTHMAFNLLSMIVLWRAIETHAI